VGSRHQASLAPTNPCASFPYSLLVLVDPLLPSNCSQSPVSDKRRRRRLRPHRGQLTLSDPTPPRLPNPHYINAVQLYDLFVGSLVPCIAVPTLAGVCPCHRRHCLCRLLLIRRIHSQLFVSISSPRPAEALALPLHRRRSPEPRHR
jgi:hypothetical protein